jgi:hypothetical protein
MENDATLEELSTLSPLVGAITGKVTGDERFYFPKAMLTTADSPDYQPVYGQFQRYLSSGHIIDPAIYGHTN